MDLHITFEPINGYMAVQNNIPTLTYTISLLNSESTVSYNLSIQNAQVLPVMYSYADKSELKTVETSITYPGSDLSNRFIPLSILKGHSSLEAIVFYLRDKKKMRLIDISRLLRRDQRTIWNVFNDAKNKKILLEDTGVHNEIFLPVDIFIGRRLSMLESIVNHLISELNMSLNEISVLLGKNYRTIWTVYRRALKKLQHDA